MNEQKTKSYNRKQKSVNPNFRKSVDPEVRKFEGELRPLMTEEEKKDEDRGDRSASRGGVRVQVELLSSA